MKQFYTYLHCRPDGTPFYVGKGSGYRSHSLFHKRNPHHRNVVAKYGAENIGVFVFYCDSEEEAFFDEISQIAQLRRDGYVLVNQTSGGEGTSNPTIEVRKKIAAASKRTMSILKNRESVSKAQKGKTLSPEHRAKLALVNKCNSWNVGKKLSSEHRAKLSISHLGNKSRLGQKLSDETKYKMSIVRRGVKKTAEHKEKISLAHKKRSAAMMASTL